jgi:hypothetical protein
MYLFCLLFFWAFVWVSRWFFWSLLIFSECWKINTLYGHLLVNFIWGFLSSTHIIFVPFNVNHSRKEMRYSFVVKFFHREGIVIEQVVIQVMVKTISLGMPHGNPLDLSTPWFAYYCCLVFWAPLYRCINLEHLHLVFSFLCASFVLNKYTTTCRYTLYLW